MGENIKISNAGKEPKFQFCTLEYRPQNWDIASSQIAPVILLVLRDEQGNLRFLVHPELRIIVHSRDLDYIESLLLEEVEIEVDAFQRMHNFFISYHACALRDWGSQSTRPGGGGGHSCGTVPEVHWR